MVTSAIQSVLSLLILIGVGYVVASQSWYPESGTAFLSKLCVQVAIPCHMFISTITNIKTPQTLAELVRNLPVPYLTILVSLLMGLAIARVFRIHPTRRGVFINAVTFSNVVLVGFVVVETIFGEAAMPDVMVYYFANTTLFWTVGVTLLRQDGEKARQLAVGPDATVVGSRNRAGIVRLFLRSLASPPLMAVVLGIVVILTRIELPDFIMSPIMSLRNMTTPLAMIFTGAIIRATDFKRTKVSRDLILVMAARFVVTPVFMVLLLRPIPITTQMKQIFFLMATMPVMTQLGIMSKESGSDYEYASLLVTFTTAFSMMALPLYLYVLERFQIF